MSTAQGGVAAEVAAIDRMDLEQLRAHWRQRHGVPPPLRSVPLMRMMLAWRLQTQAYGGLELDDLRLLARTGSPQAESSQLGIGAKLTRRWKGRPVEVIVEESGFRWNGQVYASLSAAAIARWNGPRFFGLRQAP